MGPRAVCSLIFKEKLEICMVVRNLNVRHDVLSGGKITSREIVLVGGSLIYTV